MLKFFRKNNKTIFIILTPLLAVGLVLSFTIWSSPTAGNNDTQGNRPVNQNAPTQSAEMTTKLTEIRQYEQVLKGSPENLSVWIDLGNTAYDVGYNYFFQYQLVEQGVPYFEKAVEAYKKAVELGEKDPNIMTDLATAAMYVGQDDTAEEYFQMAIETDSSHQFAKLNYAVFLINTKQEYAKAVEQLEALLALNPGQDVMNTAQTLLNQAKELQAQGADGADNSGSPLDNADSNGDNN